MKDHILKKKSEIPISTDFMIKNSFQWQNHQLEVVWDVIFQYTWDHCLHCLHAYILFLAEDLGDGINFFWTNKMGTKRGQRDSEILAVPLIRVGKDDVIENAELKSKIDWEILKFLLQNWMAWGALSCNSNKIDIHFDITCPLNLLFYFFTENEKWLDIRLSTVLA